MGVCARRNCVKFVTRRNQHKRQWDEIQEKERDKKSPVKRAKTSELPVKEQDIKSKTLNTGQPDDDKTKVKEEDKSVDHVVEVKMEDETDDEDLEEDPEENKEMEESGMQHDLPNVKREEQKTDVNAAPEKVVGIEKDEGKDYSKQKEKPKASKMELKSDGNEKTDSKANTGEKETSAVMKLAVDKELWRKAPFSPYILFLPLLVPILKNASHFGPCRYIRNREN